MEGVRIGLINCNTAILLIIAWLNCMSFGLKAQDTIRYDQFSRAVQISQDLYLFEDTSGLMVYSDLLVQPELLKKSQKQIPSYSFTKSSIWGSFHLNNTTGLPVYLEISPPILNQIKVYQFKNNVLIDSLEAGSFYSNKQSNELKSSNYVFEIKSETDFVLLKVKSKTRLFIKAKLVSYSSLISKTRKVDFLQSMYAGLILMIFIYQVFLLISTGEKIYFYYLLHLTNTGIYFLYMSGYGIGHFWNMFPGINAYFLAVISFGFILSVLFVMHFLESKQKSKPIYYLLIATIITLLINGMIDFAGYYILAGRLLNYIGLTFNILIVVATIILIKQGNKPAIIFLSAWLLYLAGIVVQTLQSLDIISTNDFTSNAIQIGSSIEIVLLAIAVGSKIKHYKKGRTDAWAGELRLMRDQEILKKNQGQQLEERFQQQTELLYEKNKELKRQNQEIENKFNEISLLNVKMKEFNELLETKNKIITTQNLELKQHKENLEQLIEERTWELQEATRLAEEADQQKTAFLKDFSHELRTPMNAIAGFSSLLMDIDPEDKSYDYYTGIIVNNTDNLLELVDNIIDLSRLQSNELSLKKVRFDLLKLFKALNDKFLEKFRKEKKSFVDLILDVPSNDPVKVYLDYNRFYKIIFQLVDNSRKYTETGFIKFGYRITDDSGAIELFVVDTGIGIKKEKLEVVFESFRKVEKSKLKFYPGTGLGLSLVKGLVSLMGGELIIDTVSEDDLQGKSSGTSIRIVIPNALDLTE